MVLKMLHTQPYKLHFLATLKIPIGYTVDSSFYQLSLSLDTSFLQVEPLTLLCPSSIMIDPHMQPPLVLESASKVYQINLHGSILYNLVIHGIKCTSPSDTPTSTAFSTQSNLPLHVTLGFVDFNTSLPASLDTLYTLDLKQEQPFVVTATGGVIPYTNDEKSEDFFEALDDNHSTQIIQVPYTLTIKPS